MRPIDLLPDPKVVRREQFIATLPRLLLWSLIVWMMLLTGIYIGFHAEKVSLQKALTSLEEQVEVLQPVAQRVQQVEALRGQVNQLQQQLEENSTERIGPAMDLLASLMPDEIVAHNLTISQDKLSFGCSSVGLPPIGRLQQNLLRTAGVSEVQVSAIRSMGETAGSVATYSFTLSFVYRGGR